MKVLYLFLLTEFLAVPCTGGVLELPAGARPVGLGSAYTAVTGSPEAIFFNPASIATSNIFSVSFFGTHLFQMKELQYITAAVNIPFAMGNWGIAFKTFGNSMYSESSVGFGWASSISRNIYFGALVKKEQLQIKGYGSDGILLFDVGLLFNVGKNITIGGAVFNLRKSSNSSYQQSIPLTYRSGLCWKIVKDFLFSFDLISSENIGFNSRFGCECMIWQKFWVRFGIEKNLPCFSSGMGIKWKKIFVDYAVRFHHYLGSTHYCSLSFSLK